MMPTSASLINKTCTASMVAPQLAQAELSPRSLKLNHFLKLY